MGVLAAVIAYRAAGQPLTTTDWAIVMSLAGLMIVRAAAATQHPFAAAISCTFVYVLKLSLVGVLRRLRRLSDRDAEALRKRIKSRFMKDL
jgi:hypothetical protein